jgi:hypothetical protein
MFSFENQGKIFSEKKRNITLTIKVLIVVGMNSSVFWDITLCIPLKISLCFGGNFASIFRVKE